MAFAWSHINIPTYFSGSFLSKEAYYSLVNFSCMGWLDEDLGATWWKMFGSDR